MKSSNLLLFSARLGIEKIRVTGGEPLVRPKVEDLIKTLSNIDEIKAISMTTNGLLLRDKVMQAQRCRTVKHKCQFRHIQRR